MTKTPEVSAADSDTGIRARIDKAVLDATPDLVRWRRHLHERPELSNREAQTVTHLIEQVREIGVDDIRSGVAGYGIVAVIRGGAVSQFERRIVHAPWTRSR
ncbi:hypothetical protein ACFU98_37355 [Streptomyces sp. NPDC057575]|uniref:hypothetical protein n=1 Tax=unclassified Streptomyces TaxID=2593676 RepID=UPI00367756D1